MVEREADKGGELVLVRHDSVSADDVEPLSPCCLVIKRQDSRETAADEVISDARAREAHLSPTLSLSLSRPVLSCSHPHPRRRRLISQPRRPPWLPCLLIASAFSPPFFPSPSLLFFIHDIHPVKRETSSRLPVIRMLQQQLISPHSDPCFTACVGWCKRECDSATV